MIEVVFEVLLIFFVLKVVFLIIFKVNLVNFWYIFSLLYLLLSFFDYFLIVEWV